MYLRTFFAIVLVCFLAFSCRTGEPDEQTAAKLTEQGWESFTLGGYQAALRKFLEAIRANPEYVDAYNGTGWTYAKLNNLDSSKIQFTTGLNKDPNNLEIKAGLSFVYNAQKDYDFSNDLALQVADSDSNWSFRRDTTITVDDLRLLIAENYFAIGNYSASLAQVKILNPGFDADVTTAEGQAALAHEIERLRT
ncbi:MAG: hypothetical protein HY707_14760 [Ignavibacteriae bacterium]|nr:hypothetical protein [Ignavibacteriota bacterium]